MIAKKKTLGKICITPLGIRQFGGRRSFTRAPCLRKKGPRVRRPLRQPSWEAAVGGLLCRTYLDVGIVVAISSPSGLLFFINIITKPLVPMDMCE
jgi:hypothetical protein